MIDWLPTDSLSDDMRPILVYVPGTWELPEAYHIVFRKRPGVYVLQDEDHFIIDNFTCWAELTPPVNRWLTSQPNVGAKMSDKPTDDVTEKDYPFQVGYAENPGTGAYDVQIDVGGFAGVEECAAFGEMFSTWMAGERGWKTRVN